MSDELLRELKFTQATVDQLEEWAAQVAEPTESLFVMLEQSFNILRKVKQTWPKERIEKEALDALGRELSAWAQSPATPMAAFFVGYGQLVTGEDSVTGRLWSFRTAYGFGRPLSEEEFKPFVLALNNLQDNPPPIGPVLAFRGNLRKTQEPEMWSVNDARPPITTFRPSPNALPELGEDFDLYLWLEECNDERYTAEEIAEETKGLTADEVLEIQEGWHTNEFMSDFGAELMAFHNFWSEGLGRVSFSKLCIVKGTLQFIDNRGPAASGNWRGTAAEISFDMDRRDPNAPLELREEMPLWIPTFVKGYCLDPLTPRPTGYFVGRVSLNKRYDREARHLTDEDQVQMDLYGFVPEPLSAISAEELQRLQSP